MERDRVHARSHIPANRNRKQPFLTTGKALGGKTRATAGDDYTVRLWNTTSGRVRAVLTGCRGSVMNMAVSPDGQSVAAVGVSSPAMLWEMRGGRFRFALSGGSNGLLLFSPDSRRLATWSFLGSSVDLWDVAKTQVLPMIAGSQAELGNETAARQIMESLQRWWEKGPQFGPRPTVFRGSGHLRTAIDKARAGDIPGAMAALETETDPHQKARMLVNMARVLLEAGPSLPAGRR